MPVHYVVYIFFFFYPKFLHFFLQTARGDIEQQGCNLNHSSHSLILHISRYHLTLHWNDCRQAWDTRHRMKHEKLLATGLPEEWGLSMKYTWLCEGAVMRMHWESWREKHRNQIQYIRAEMSMRAYTLKEVLASLFKTTNSSDKGWVRSVWQVVEVGWNTTMSWRSLLENEEGFRHFLHHW